MISRPLLYPNLPFIYSQSLYMGLIRNLPDLHALEIIVENVYVSEALAFLDFSCFMMTSSLPRSLGTWQKSDAHSFECLQIEITVLGQDVIEVPQRAFSHAHDIGALNPLGIYSRSDVLARTSLCLVRVRSTLEHQSVVSVHRAHGLLRLNFVQFAGDDICLDPGRVMCLADLNLST